MMQKVLLGFFRHSDSTALLQCNSTKHPCKHGMLWSYSHCIGFCFKCQCMCRIRQYSWGILQFIIKRVYRYDITAGQESWCFAEIGPCTLYTHCMVNDNIDMQLCMSNMITLLFNGWFIYHCQINQWWTQSTFTVASIGFQSFDYLINIFVGSYS